MAGSSGEVLRVIQIVLILSITQRIYTARDTSIHQLTVQENIEHSSDTQLLSYYKLQNFNGHFLLHTRGTSRFLAANEPKYQGDFRQYFLQKKKQTQ